MKKSKILAAVLLLAMFSSVLTVVKFSSPVSGSSETPATPVVSPEALGDPLGTKGVWLNDVTGLITVDGALGDWATVPHAMCNGVDTYVGNDSTYAYVAVAWVDSSKFDGKVSEWNKTGATLDNVTNGAWVEYDGADDMVSVGFSNGTYTDMWTWAYSIRGDGSYAYETDGTGKADGGALPFVRNIDVAEAAQGWDQPETDNSSVAIPSHVALPNGTSYIGWFDNVPGGSQTNVDIAYTYNTSGDDRYIVEFRRLLDTGSQVDDIKLDLNDLTGMTFFVGRANKQSFIDMDVSVAGYAIADDNVAAEFTWDIFASPVTEALLITGKVWDDYVNPWINIQLSGWLDTYGDVWGTADVNTFTGDWSYLFYYDEDDMPLGDYTVNISFVPKYDPQNDTYQNITIVDDEAPKIVGLVNLNTQYPNGVPNGTDYVPVTVGVSDNYAYWVGGLAGYSDTDLLTVYLYSYAEDEIALMTPMVQFSSGGATFSANLTLPSIAAGTTYNYTYFVEVFDPSNNKVTSVHYWFIHGEIIVVPTPGFGILAGLFGLAGAAFIIYKKRK
jgi:hypothetical protein